MDWEPDGNQGTCIPNGFPPYDVDECFADPDAGLIVPGSYTIDAALNVVPCPGVGGVPAGPLGQVCTGANWGPNIDIIVRNPSNLDVFVNVLADWNQSGEWSGADPCPLVVAPEHILVDFVVPAGYRPSRLEV